MPPWASAWPLSMSARTVIAARAYPARASSSTMPNARLVPSRSCRCWAARRANSSDIPNLVSLTGWTIYLKRFGANREARMAFETILFEVTNGAARLTLNRPDRLNSFTVQMHDEVARALTTVETDPSARVLLITGAGRGFCAGQDLSDRAVAPGGEGVDLGASLDKSYNPLVRRLTALPKPVVCAVNGVAAGAGANIAFAADIVMAAKSAKFIQSFANIGLVPDSGGTWIL